MPFIPAVDTARVCVNQTLHGQNICNVLHFFKAGGYSEADLTALANAVITAWNDNMAPAMSTDIQFTSVTARDMSAVDAEAVEVPFPALSGGDIVNVASPGNVAIVVSWKTGFAGRSRRGRTYLSGVSEDGITGNEINADRLASIRGLVTDFIADMTAAGFQLAIASYFSGVDGNGDPIPRATALVTPVLTAIVDKWLDSQRRRLQGRGS